MPLVRRFKVATPKSLSKLRCPVFYLSYNSDPMGNPWKDAIGEAVRLLRGHEYGIRQPRDLWPAWRDVMSHLQQRPDLVPEGTPVNSR